MNASFFKFLTADNASKVYFSGGVRGQCSDSDVPGVGDVLFDAQTGFLQVRMTQLGAFTIFLNAFLQNVENSIQMMTWNFTVARPDTSNPQFGPNGLACSTNGTGTARDAVPLDEQFDCLCLEGHAGANCQYSKLPN